jgi:hypothetical protein
MFHELLTFLFSLFILMSIVLTNIYIPTSGDSNASGERGVGEGEVEGGARVECSDRKMLHPPGQGILLNFYILPGKLGERGDFT